MALKIMTKQLRRPRVNALVKHINAMSPEDREAFAASCKTSVGNLRQVAYGYGSCSISLAKLIATNCDDVRITDLIPELNSLQDAA